jgi:lipopolysaccharide export system permease protein
MKILTRYITKAVLGPLFFGIFAFTIMILGATFINIMREFEQYHLPLLLQLKLLSLYIPKNLLIGSALAVLLSTILGLGNLTAHSETIAMRAGGLSYFRLAIPVLMVGLAVSGLGIFITEYINPYSYRVLEKMRTEILSPGTVDAIYDFKEFIPNSGAPEKIIYARKFDPKKQELKNVIIIELTNGKVTRTIQANTMYWKGRNWFFNRGRINQITPETLYPILVRRANVKYPLNLTPGQIVESQIPPEEQSISGLNKLIQSITPKESKGKSSKEMKAVEAQKVQYERRALLVELYGKIAKPFASVIFSLIGIPLALRPQRRSNAAGFGLCLLFLLLWWILYMIGSSMARMGVISPFIGAWLANIVTAGYGIYVFTKVKI